MKLICLNLQKKIRDECATIKNQFETAEPKKKERKKDMKIGKW